MAVFIVPVPLCTITNFSAILKPCLCTSMLIYGYWRSLFMVQLCAFEPAMPCHYNQVTQLMKWAPRTTIIILRWTCKQMTWMFGECSVAYASLLHRVLTADLTLNMLMYYDLHCQCPGCFVTRNATLVLRAHYLLWSGGGWVCWDEMWIMFCLWYPGRGVLFSGEKNRLKLGLTSEVSQLYKFMVSFEWIPLFYLASFPGCSHLQYLIACSMQIRRGKAWEISSRAVTSGRQKVDTRGAVPNEESWSPFLYYQSEGWSPER